MTSIISQRCSKTTQGGVSLGDFKSDNHLFHPNFVSSVSNTPNMFKSEAPNSQRYKQEMTEKCYGFILLLNDG